MKIENKGKTEHKRKQTPDQANKTQKTRTKTRALPHKKQLSRISSLGLVFLFLLSGRAPCQQGRGSRKLGIVEFLPVARGRGPWPLARGPWAVARGPWPVVACGPWPMGRWPVAGLWPVAGGL